MKKVLLLIFLSCYSGADVSILLSAEKDLHVREIPGKDKSNPKITEYHESTGHNYKDNIPWCSSFVNYHVTKAGYVGTNSTAAASWRTWGQGIIKPKVGAIAVKPRFNKKGKKIGDHVGIIKSINQNNKTLLLLGGNQGKRGEVTESIYPISAFDSFRIPGDQKIYNVQVELEEIKESIKLSYNLIGYGVLTGMA